MTKKNWLLIFAAVALIAVAVAGYFAWDLKLSGHAKAKAALLEYLNDPDSARLTELRYNPDTGVLCGNLNAKNRMGGYSGKTAFVASKHGVVRIEPKDEINVTTEEKLEAVQKKIAFLTYIQGNCLLE